MLVVSHRGYHRHHPENTLAAFEAAIQLGVDGLEADIRLSADDVALLFHNRLAPDGREVRAVTHPELTAAAGYPVPTLDEALALWPDRFWVLEIKRPEALAATVEILKSRGPGFHCLVISFWHTVVLELRKHLDVDCGILMSQRPLDLAGAIDRRFRERGVETIVWNYEYLDEGLVDKARALGYRSMVYNPQSAEQHRHCAAMKIAGAITDYPELLIS